VAGKARCKGKEVGVKKVFSFFFLAGLILFACSNQSEPSPLMGDWKLTTYGSAELTQLAASGVEAAINFSKDGTVNGSLGCNHFGGEYKLKGEQIIFDALSTTLMACPEPQMSQEQAAFLVLSGTVTYTIEGNTLTIENGGNVLVFQSITQSEK
jgi:heat shock protein HslJ